MTNDEAKRVKHREDWEVTYLKVCLKHSLTVISKDADYPGKYPAYWDGVRFRLCISLESGYHWAVDPGYITILEKRKKLLIVLSGQDIK